MVTVSCKRFRGNCCLEKGVAVRLVAEKAVKAERSKGDSGFPSLWSDFLFRFLCLVSDLFRLYVLFCRFLLFHSVSLSSSSSSSVLFFVFFSDGWQCLSMFFFAASCLILLASRSVFVLQKECFSLGLSVFNYVFNHPGVFSFISSRGKAM
ncbi:hypothetical protein P8452_33789 [Trifolium repens]|nr:hypothetical protein P8452_33789 [Trifolium repens]